MGDDYRPRDAKQWSPTADFRIHTFLERTERPFEEEGTKQANPMFLELPFHPGADGMGNAFGRLENDIPNESVANNHIRFALEEIVPLDIPAEVDVQPLKQRKCFCRSCLSRIYQ